MIATSRGRRRTARTEAALRLLVPLILATSAWADDWEKPTTVSTTANSLYYDIAVDADGSVLLAWSQIEPSDPQRSQVYFQRRSRDFEPLIDPVPINDSIQGGGPLFCQDSNGNVHILWGDNRNHPPPFPENDLFYTLVTRDGETIVADTMLLEGNAGGRFGSTITFGDDGLVHVVMRDGTNQFFRYLRIDLEGTVVSSTEIHPPGGNHDLRWPRIFPRSDGTSLLIYLDNWAYPATFSRVYSMRIDGDGTILDGPLRVSSEEERTYDELTLASDSRGRIHLAFHETPYEVFPVEDRILHYYYRMLDPDGVPLTPIWTMTTEPYRRILFRTAWIGVDDFDRPCLFVLRVGSEVFFPHYARPYHTATRIAYFVLDPFTGSLSEHTSLVRSKHIPSLVFRTDGKGGWVGMYGDDSFDGYPHYQILRTNPDSICRDGRVAAASSVDVRTLTLNGSSGDSRHVETVPAGVALSLAIRAPEAMPGVRFYVQARSGTSGAGEPRWFPGVGLACFDFLDHETARAIWNGLGGLRGKLGSSRVLGHPIPDPPSVPGVFFTIPGQATANLPAGTRVVFQGLQSDPTSRKGFSVTNAVILRIE